MYLHGETQLEIRESFEDCSEISLNDFLVVITFIFLLIMHDRMLKIFLIFKK